MLACACESIKASPRLFGWSCIEENAYYIDDATGAPVWATKLLKKEPYQTTNVTLHILVRMHVVDSLSTLIPGGGAAHHSEVACGPRVASGLSHGFALRDPMKLFTCDSFHVMCV